MREIDRAIRQKETQLEKLRHDLEALRRARDVLKEDEALPASDEDSATTSRRGHARTRDHVRPKSAIGVTLAILRERRVPQHVDALLAELATRGIDAKKQSLVSSLAKLSKERRLFCRAPAPSTFGLIEWQGQNGVANGVAPVGGPAM